MTASVSDDFDNEENEVANDETESASPDRGNYTVIF